MMEYTRHDALLHAWFADVFNDELARGRLMQGRLVPPHPKPGRRRRDGRPHYYRHWLIEGVLPSPLSRHLISNEHDQGFELLRSRDGVVFAVPTLTVKSIELAFVVPLVDTDAWHMLRDLAHDPLQLDFTAHDLSIRNGGKLDFTEQVQQLPQDWRTPSRTPAGADLRLAFGGALSQYVRQEGRALPRGVRMTFAMLVLSTSTAQRMLRGGPTAALD